MMVTLLHWASLLPECRSPVFTWPICKQFSRPITSIRLSPMSAWRMGKYSILLNTSLYSICNVFLRTRRSSFIIFVRGDYFLDYFALSSPWIAAVRSTELKLLVLSSLSGRFFRLPRRCRVWCSPQRFEPPWVKGMFSKATPCRDGPCAKSRGVPSHCNRWNARSVTNSIDSIELIDYEFDCICIQNGTSWLILVPHSVFESRLYSTLDILIH